MTVIDGFKEIHVHHNKNEIAVIHFADVATPRALIISQYLPGLSSEDLFHIPPVPHSGQHIGKRNFLQFQILSLQFKTVPAQRMFFVLKFVLEPAHFVQVVPRHAK